MSKAKLYYGGPHNDPEKEPYRVGFRCPGCGDTHLLQTPEINAGSGAIWGFNGDFDRPTFTPSILQWSGHYMPGYNSDKCWCTWTKEHPADEGKCPTCYICHSFVTDGKIQFLSDCSHSLAGQTVELPEID